MKRSEWVQEIEDLFSKHADPVAAKKQSAYLLDQFSFLGLPKPKRASLQKKFFKELCHLKREDLIEIVSLLWEKPHRELHYVAVDLLTSHWKILEESDLGWIEGFIRTHAWWDTVDVLSSNVLGKFLLRHKSLCSHMDHWIEDEFLWIRRSALIFQLRWKKETEEERLFGYCKKRMHENNFFIRKGIGWALREYSKYNPQGVIQFLKENASSLSRLSYREANRHLSKTS